MPKRLCNSCCNASKGCGGQRSISATKLRASRRGSSCSRRGLNTERTARNNNSIATNPGKIPIRTATRIGHTAFSPANNKHSAPSTRLMIATRVSCASETASGHCAGFSWASCRSSTSRPNANNNANAAPTVADKPTAAGGKVRFQTCSMLSTASSAQPPNHSVAAPIWPSRCRLRSLNRSSSRSYHPCGGDCSSPASGASTTGLITRARHCVTHHADCSPATSTSSAAL
ncbi:hypothetical protein D3C81_1308220 [compost metagenome]